MIINIQGTWFGWWSDEAFVLYLIVDTILVMLYCAIWIICFKKNSVFRALALSIIPSMLFLFSGIMSRSVLLLSLIHISQRKMQKELQNKGYNDIFIPNLMVLSPTYAEYKKALDNLNDRMCRELGLYYDSNYNLVIKKDNSK